MTNVTSGGNHRHGRSPRWGRLLCEADLLPIPAVGLSQAAAAPLIFKELRLSPSPMNASASPASHDWHPTSRADAKSAWAISTATRQHAQQADAFMTRDDWKYDSPDGPAKSPAVPAAGTFHH